jgi:predicted CopG family antitoxin
VKREGESFSKLIERLISKKENPWLIMQNKFYPEFFNELNENIRALRENNLTRSEKDE